MKRVFYFYLILSLCVSSWTPAVVSSSEGDSLSSLIPANLGTIVEHHEGTSYRPVVYFIQDAHSLVEAQRAIRDILRHLRHTQPQLDLVALEGASRPLDTDLLASFPDQERMEKELWKFAEEGELSGAEIQAVSDPGFPFEGIEDPVLYKESLGIFRLARAHYSKSVPDLRRLGNRLAELSTQLFTQNLAQLLELQRSFEKEEISLAALLEDLKPFGLKVDKAYPAISEMLDVFDKEEVLERDKALRASVLEWVQRESLRSPAGNQIRQSYETSRATLGDAVRALRELPGVEISAQEKDRLRSITSLDALEKISGVLFMEELERWTTAKEDELAGNESGKKLLLEKLRDLSLLERFVALEVTSDEWVRIEKRLGSFKSEEFERFLKGQGINEQFSWDLKPASRFYQLAIIRNRSLVDNLGRVTQGSDITGSVILVAGGFHAQGVAELLKKNGFSYFLISPKFHPGKENPYLKVMMGSASSLSAQKAALPPEVRLEEGSSYRARVESTVARNLLPQEGGEYQREITDWADNLIVQWKAGETKPDISGPLNRLREFSRPESAAAAAQGRSLGDAEKSNTQLLKIPDVLNTNTVQQDVFNYAVTLLEDPDYGFSRVMVFLVDEKDDKPIALKGYMAFDTSILSQTGEYKAPSASVSLEDILKKKYESWKIRGKGGNLYPIETMTKGYDLFLENDQSLMAQLIKTGSQKPTVKKLKAGDELQDSLMYALYRDDLKVPTEFVLVPMIYGGKVIGVTYADNTDKSETEEISLAQQQRLQVFANGVARSIQTSKKFESFQYQRTHDSLTDLLNRAGMEEPFRDAIETAVRNKGKVSIVAGDLDYFKNVNDTHGHLAGDEVLKDVGKVIKNTVRFRAFPMRLGGDEFVVLLPNTNTHDGYQLAESLKKNIKNVKVAGTKMPPDFKVSMSSGLATYGAVSVGNGYVVLIPHTHDERAAALITQFSKEKKDEMTGGATPQIGERMITVEGLDFPIFVFDIEERSVLLNEQIRAVHHRIYDVIYTNADIAASVSKGVRDKVTVYSVEVQKQHDEAKESAAMKALRKTAQDEFQKFPVAAHRLNREGTILDVTDRWLALLGYVRDEVVGHEIFDFLPMDARALAKANHRQRMGLPPDTSSNVLPAVEGSQNIHLTRFYLTKTGSRVPVASDHGIVRDEVTKRVMNVTTVLNEASAQKFLKKRARLDHSEIAFDDKGVIFLASRGFMTRLGYSSVKDSEQFEGRPVIQIFPVEEHEKVNAFLIVENQPELSLQTWLRSSNGLRVEIMLRKGKDPEFPTITTLTILPKSSASGKSLGTSDSLDTLKSLGSLVQLRSVLSGTGDPNSDLWAKQIFHLTGLTREELDGESARYLEDRDATPYFFKGTDDVKVSNFLLLDMDSLAEEPGLLARAAELVGDNGKILPFATDKTSSKSLENFRTQFARLSKDQPVLGAKVLKVEKVTGRPLTAEVVGRIKVRAGLKDASLGILVSQAKTLEGDYAALVPVGKQAIAFVFDAASNHVSLSKTVYSVAFSAFLRGAQDLDILKEPFVKPDQGSGITFYSFDLVELAAALTAEWQAEAALLRAA